VEAADGTPWREVPDRYGRWKTCPERLRRWSADGTWDRLLSQLQVRDDGVPVEWTVHMDSSVVRAHQHSAGARKRGRGSPAAVAALAGEAIGRSSGGLTSKIHVAVDGPGPPLTVLLTEAKPGTTRASSCCWTPSGSTTGDPDGPGNDPRI
jgi:transposase